MSEERENQDSLLLDSLAHAQQKLQVPPPAVDEIVLTVCCVLSELKLIFPGELELLSTHHVV